MADTQKTKQSVRDIDAPLRNESEDTPDKNPANPNGNPNLGEQK